MSKKVIHFNESGYLTELSKQTKMQDLFNDMLMEAEKAEVEIHDYKAFIDNPVEYILDQYWEENKQFFPKGVQKEKAIKNTEFDQSMVSKLFGEYNRLKGTCKGLKVTKKSTALTLDQEDYNWYLAEGMEKEHETLERFLQCASELEEFTNVTYAQLQRGIQGKFLLKNNRLEINPNLFKA
ncbi:hypothetical protein [Christiangramia sabulilitoris]|uniref:Uncharacterized protein n=1 Tax=Christiangramia sabulilitoris TaxID=2583991 RepID=A0A550I3D0_9FLAO|nr:hypothetical protein [Christiangramia sabulilitoris]TRO65490.1 hypothetical protein FGM01_08815 [Christiangramia sabulilitoris]